MIKKSKVTSVQNNGTWEGKFGMMYKFEVAFENGDCGEYSSKSQDQNKFVKDQEMEYEFLDGKFPKVKPVYQQAQSFSGSSNKGYKEDPKKQKIIAKLSLIKSAQEYCNGNNCSTTDIIKVAQEWLDWVLEDKMPNENNEMPF